MKYFEKIAEDKIQINPLTNLAIGAFGGVTSGIATYPLENISRAQSAAGMKARGIFRTAAKLYGNGGIKALYAGMSPKLLKGTIGNAIAFGSILTLKELNDSRLNTK